MRKPSNPKSVLAAILALLLTFSAHASEKLRAVGFQAEPEAAYRSVPKIQRTRGFLPEAVDLANRMPTPGDQGDSSSCTAWAVAYAARSYYAAGAAGVERLDVAAALSPAYVYNRLNGGSCTQPTSIMDALTLMRDEGVVPIRDFPLPASDCRQLPSNEQKRAAGNFRIRNWSRLDTDDLDAIKSQLFNGHPVIVVLNLPRSFDRLRGDVVFDDRADRNFPHVMLAVGYDDQRQAFRLMNSWATDWADGGFVWVAYRAYSALKIDRAYVIDLPVPPPLSTSMAKTALPLPISKIAEKSAPAPVVVDNSPATKPSASPQPAEGTSLDTLPNKLPARLAKLACTNVAGVGPVQNSLRNLPWPQCEIELNFKGALAARHGLSAQLSGADDGIFKAGASLGVEITLPDYPTYLYVTYLQSGGEVVHLHWAGSEGGRALAPGSRVLLGGGQAGRPSYRIGPPFGDEAVVIVASASPLFFGQIPKMPDDRAYLSEFRRAFAVRPADGSGKRRVEAMVLPLRTVNGQ